ncbi:MAG: NrsF family protein [Rhodanobacter sp.]
MSEQLSQQGLIDRLGSELLPVQRLLPPWQRAVGWLLVVAAIAIALLWHFGDAGMLQRLGGAPDLAWAAFGAVITAISAAWAAFSLGVPGRRVGWAWLPLPGALLWIGASGLGCLRTWLAPDTSVATLHQSADCLVFIISFSVPLSVLLILMLRRACPLRPVLAAVMIGLASAAASASLLEICHAYDSAATDLLTHALAVAVVIGVNAAMGGRLLAPRRKS